MTREQVDSSDLVSVGYKGWTLEIEFKNGAVWDYEPVPASVHKALMEADSKGKYFHKNIRKNGEYIATKVG